MTSGKGTAKLIRFLPAFFVQRGESSEAKPGLCCSMEISCTVLLMVCFTAISLAQVPFLKKKDKDFQDLQEDIADFKRMTDEERHAVTFLMSYFNPNELLVNKELLERLGD